MDDPTATPVPPQDAPPPPPRGKYLTAPLPSTEMPRGIPYIVGNEAAERFSFYGMRAILAVFLTEHLLNAQGQLAPMDENVANVWQHRFVFAVYFFPIVGAIVSDWLLGKYRTIILLSLVYVAGHAVMAMVDYPTITGIDPRTTLFVALGLIAIGSGGIKPCVSAHVGDQFGHQNQHLLAKVFGWFYFSINLGSAISTVLTPELLARYGPGVAFGVPGVLMAIATLVFWLGRHKFVHVPAGGRALFREMLDRDGLRAVRNLVPLYVLIAMFWCLFDQTQSAWVHQAKDMNLVVFGTGDDAFRLRPSQLQAFNPILVMILIPLFSYGLYPLLGRWFEVTPLRKIGIGLFISGFSFALAGWIQTRIDVGQSPHIIWQFFAYVIITAAEVMVSITALEFSYTQAPKKMKSLIMSGLMLSIAAGNLFAAEVNDVIAIKKEQGVAILQGANYYWFFTAAMFLSALAFVVWSQFYRGRTYIQGDGST